MVRGVIIYGMRSYIVVWCNLYSVWTINEPHLPSKTGLDVGIQWKYYQSTAEIDDMEDAANNREYDTKNENDGSKAYTYWYNKLDYM